MKVQILAAAIALAASVNVSAAIQGPIGAEGSFANPGGTSEAVFTIWDPTTNQSYAQDLGTTWQVFRDNLGNTSFAVSYTVDANVYAAAVGASDTANLIWNVSVATTGAPDFSNFGDKGVIGTSNLGNLINTAAIGGATNAHDQYATILNSLGAVGENAAYFGDLNNGAYAGSDRVWGTSWQRQAPENNTAAFGTDLDFYYWQDTGFDTLGAVTKAAGSWSFDGTTLSYGAATSAVPVPAAAWLFGSGLLGLVGVARRKSQQA